MSHGGKTMRQVEDLRKAMARLLAGKPAMVQGAALADLLATWIAGHHPDLRDEVLALHLEYVNWLVEVNAKHLVELGTLPPEWQKTPSDFSRN